MFPAPFTYHRAASVEDALRLLAEHDDAKLLAGGHSLLPMMKLRLASPETLIDIGRIAALRGVERRGDAIRIGALTTHDELANSPVLRADCPLLAEAAAKIADPAVRNKGTLGGNVAHADPASDLPSVLVALEATFHLTGAGGSRAVAAADFFVGLLETALGEHELLTHVELLPWTGRSGACYLKHEHPASGYAICAAAAAVTIDDNKVVTAARLAVGGVTATPLDLSPLAAEVVGHTPHGALLDRAFDDLTVDDPLGDVQASGAYRVALAGIYARRALVEAYRRACE